MCIKFCQNVGKLALHTIWLKWLLERFLLATFLNGFVTLKKSEHLQKATPSVKQDKSVVHSFLRSKQCCASWVRSRGSHNKQGILFTSSEATLQCNMMQVTRKVVIGELTNPVRQCISTLISTYATFLSQTQNPTRAATSIASQPCTVGLFSISQNKTWSEREKIWGCGNHKMKHDTENLFDIELTVEKPLE